MSETREAFRSDRALDLLLESSQSCFIRVIPPFFCVNLNAGLTLERKRQAMGTATKCLLDPFMRTNRTSGSQLLKASVAIFLDTLQHCVAGFSRIKLLLPSTECFVVHTIGVRLTPFPPGLQASSRFKIKMIQPLNHNSGVPHLSRFHHRA